MHRQDIARELLARRISAIIRADDASVAREAMRAAVRGGFRVVEFTLTTPDALALIAEFRQSPELLVGAGTVLTPEQACAAAAAGAQFLVSPVFDPAIVQLAGELRVPCLPGTATPTEMIAAHHVGADFVKLFPAPHDIPAYVRQVLAPLPFLRIFPTAGVTPENFLSILGAGAVGVGFVSSLFRADELTSRDYAAIERRARGITAAADDASERLE